ncbi:hypothetical protein [Pseudomonas eucalypticola]|uniref:Uncharacterized protein n=1 Tax=Pseudomonas eucalypticola TaxID=2599595 RepID=A0A7D5DC51_9PSED|nr:hypothetical protein [Pseudomonas eucalypticola]QKZ07852.1 hypothetical protein HWQ56_28925 [Pseudomonas eucalypticola]
MFEDQLEDAAKNTAIRQFIVRQMTPAKFGLVVILTWKEGENVLFNARKQARLWPNLNTLVGYIRGLQCRQTPITLELDYDSTDDS